MFWCFWVTHLRRVWAVVVGLNSKLSCDSRTFAPMPISESSSWVLKRWELDSKKRCETHMYSQIGFGTASYKLLGSCRCKPISHVLCSSSSLETSHWAFHEASRLRFCKITEYSLYYKASFWKTKTSQVWPNRNSVYFTDTLSMAGG